MGGLTRAITGLQIKKLMWNALELKLQGIRHRLYNSTLLPGLSTREAEYFSYLGMGWFSGGFLACA